MMTLKEYLEDYATADTKEMGEALIKAEMKNIPKDKIRQLVEGYLENIRKGERDFVL